MRSNLNLAAVTAAVLACTPRAPDPAATAAALDSAYATFSEAYRTADPGLVAGLYADSALYLAKSRGRDQVVVYNPKSEPPPAA